ncbi:non-lysosomal glucosylceramidase-like [Papaver somniferum]|uniref:non-lysosomal glucosylceramidase-like n=1 Tax=Papaver somniferum TaxID=3469 RepID=UPI000E6FCFCB|nr:non-lysosomal glucosylceramidase-like [Papaver somniferum]
MDSGYSYSVAKCKYVYMEQFYKDGDDVIESDGFPDRTRDAWTVHGISAYYGCLWLASLDVAAAVGKGRRDCKPL